MKTESKFLREIVKEANEISNQKFDAFIKGGENDLVTTLDYEIEKFLIDKIGEQYPNFDIVSEEYNTVNKVTDNCFVIDPIDGTINFANNLPLWGIQIACVKNGETIASVISLPRINEFYYADETGAYLNDEKISINEVPIKNALYAIDGNNNLPSMQRMRKYSSNRRNFGCVCVSMAFVASGRIHGAVFRSNKPWDYEPGLFICKMAGASIKSVDGFHAAAMNEEFLNILELETAKKQNVSNIFILHSLNGDTLNIWGQDIKDVFGAKEIDVIMPEFPIRADSKYEKFKEILKFYLDNGKLNGNSIVVAHSIGNAYFIRFCKELHYEPKAYIAVAPGAIYDYPTTRNDYFVDVLKQSVLKPDSFDFIKNASIKKYCLYSDEDNNNQEKFVRFIDDTNSEGIYLKYYNHFDGYHRIYRIPELIELISSLL
ncbi:MAG: inositol monophosphatase [Erysipelotrichales bacterium]|nr:inositol monophosphatase [Erysipelotrichales bacterium]